MSAANPQWAPTQLAGVVVVDVAAVADVEGVGAAEPPDGVLKETGEAARVGPIDGPRIEVVGQVAENGFTPIVTEAPRPIGVG